MTEFRTEVIDGVQFKHPTILYKYRCWDNDFHKKILIENKLYMASPKDFEDIYDCNVPEKFPDKCELYSLFLDKAKSINPQGTWWWKRKFAMEWVKKSPLSDPKRRSESINEWKQEFDNCFGVLSMTTDCANDEMWCKYADNHKGFCIGFDTSLLFECVGGGGEVNYVDVLPTIDFVNDDFNAKHVKSIFYKEKKWSFEKEYRLHKMWKHFATEEDRNIEFPKDCIVKIILGKNMPSEMKEEIKKISSIKHPNAEIVENS